MCPICYCEMEVKTQAKIEGCIHLFCFECIKEWATKQENTCPLCKKRFNLIKHINEDGVNSEFKVETKNQRIDDEGYEMDDESDDTCYVCG